jgi:hypothetical protein
LARSAKSLMIRTESYLVENIFTLNNAENETAALFYLNYSIINYLNYNIAHVALIGRVN